MGEPKENSDENSNLSVLQRQMSPNSCSKESKPYILQRIGESQKKKEEEKEKTHFFVNIELETSQSVHIAFFDQLRPFWLLPL